MFTAYLTARSVSVLSLVNGQNHCKAYINSPSGRITLAEEQPPEVVNEVLTVWGDTPTMPDTQNEQLTLEQQASDELSALKAKLVATDYQAIKYAEGWLTAEEYAPIREQRQAWRDEINRLELSL